MNQPNHAPPGRDRNGAGDITALLRQWGDGNAEAMSMLFPLLYDRLHALARGLMRDERTGHTLQPTALVHEAYLSLCAGQALEPRDRLQFLAAAAVVMRRQLVDHARRRDSRKRGGGVEPLPLDEARASGPSASPTLVMLDEALTALERWDARKARVAALRWFGGFSVEETAEHLGVSKPTVILDTRLAKAWLYRRLNGSAP